MILFYDTLLLQIEHEEFDVVIFLTMFLFSDA